KVGNLGAPARAYLSYQTATGGELDSTDVTNGEFTFHGTVVGPSRAMVLITHKGENIREMMDPDRMEVYLEKGVIAVTANDSLVNASIKGGEVNRDFAIYSKEIAPIQSKIDGVMSRYAAAPEEKKQDPAFMQPLQ